MFLYSGLSHEEECKGVLQFGIHIFKRILRDFTYISALGIFYC